MQLPGAGEYSELAGFTTHFAETLETLPKDCAPVGGGYSAWWLYRRVEGDRFSVYFVDCWHIVCR